MKNESKHTLGLGHATGPWKFEKCLSVNRKSIKGSITSNIGLVIADISLEHNKTHYSIDATARLIASAPELLEILKEGEDIISGLEADLDNAGIDGFEARQWWQRAQAIINKAEGVE